MTYMAYMAYTEIMGFIKVTSYDLLNYTNTKKNTKKTLMQT